ncbi:MAG: TolC family protein [Aquabacterium sp.]|nr:TolC family protein [Aquabacterium sp.]
MGSGVAQAQSFEDAVRAARQADAQYAAQRASVDGRRLQSRQAASAYFPSASAGYTRTDSAGSAARSLSVTQPLVSYERYLTLQQSEPLAALAQAEARQADSDLILRVHTAMAEIVRQRESIRSLGVQIDGLQEQFRRAVRLRELGQGTVTEVSDFEVRVAVAQGNRVNQQTALQAAVRSFTLLTGLTPDVAKLALVLPQAGDEPADAQAAAAVARASAPAPVSARLNLALTRIASRRVKAQYLPELSIQAGYSQSAGAAAVNTAKLGFSVTVPLTAGGYYQFQQAEIDLVRAQESLRFAEESAASDAARLHQTAAALSEEVLIRKRALEGARLAVDANLKSYLGGVKSNIDVVTSYQILADAEVALVGSELARGEARLRLALLVSDRLLP